MNEIIDQFLLWKLFATVQNLPDFTSNKFSKKKTGQKPWKIFFHLQLVYTKFVWHILLYSDNDLATKLFFPKFKCAVISFVVFLLLQSFKCFLFVPNKLFRPPTLSKAFSNITWTLNKTFAHFRNLNAEKLKYQTFNRLFSRISESSEPTWYAANRNPSLGRTWDTSPPPRENASRKAGDERAKSVHDARAAAEKSFHEPVKTEEVTKVERENNSKVRDGNTEGENRKINSKLKLEINFPGKQTFKEY